MKYIRFGAPAAFVLAIVLIAATMTIADRADEVQASGVATKTEYHTVEPPALQLTSPESEEDSGALYYLTPAERDEVERVVMAEAGGECRLGQMAVAQCIYDACLKEGIRPVQAVLDYGYTKSRPEPSVQVQEAVSAVFDVGEMAVADDILYFYAPDRCSGAGHEERHDLVATIGGHKFFKDKVA